MSAGPFPQPPPDAATTEGLRRWLLADPGPHRPTRMWWAVVVPAGADTELEVLASHGHMGAVLRLSLGEVDDLIGAAAGVLSRIGWSVVGDWVPVGTGRRAEVCPPGSSGRL